MFAFDILNNDVLHEIFLFIPISIKRQLNTTYYYKYCPRIPLLNSFVRAAIRKDYDFIFSYHLTLHYERWLSITQWYYKNMKFHNYIEYIRYLCIEYESMRCKNKLNALENKYKPNAQKKYKKKKIRNIRWNN